MQKWGHRAVLWGIVCVLVLVVAVAWTQTAPPAKTKLERLRVAVAPLGWDTNFTWLQSRSGMLDKRPALEYLVGIDRNTGAYTYTNLRLADPTRPDILQSVWRVGIGLMYDF